MNDGWEMPSSLTVPFNDPKEHEMQDGLFCIFNHSFYLCMILGEKIYILTV